MFRFDRFLALLPALAFTGQAGAIVIRHDRPDSDYVVRASKYACVGRVSGFAEGTLVGDRWVLTAAHVTMGLNPFNASVTFGGRRYGVKSVIFHPKGDIERDPNHIDMAMMYLSEPVKGIKPALLYSGKDEAGKIVTFVGSGQTGNGNTGPTGRDGKTRAAENQIDSVNERQIIFKFDAPPNALPREGISGPGDSGGPALIEKGGRFYVLGVSNANSNPPGQKHCTYGTSEYYARVSTQIDWIKSVMVGKVAPNSGWGTPVDQLSESPEKSCVEEFFQMFNSGDQQRMDSFDQAWRTSEALARRTPDQRWAVMQELRSANGDLKPVKYAKSHQGSISVLVVSAKRGRLGLEFLFDRRSGVKLLGFTVVPLDE